MYPPHPHLKTHWVHRFSTLWDQLTQLAPRGPSFLKTSLQHFQQEWAAPAKVLKIRNVKLREPNIFQVAITKLILSDLPMTRRVFVAAHSFFVQFVAPKKSFISSSSSRSWLSSPSSFPWLSPPAPSPRHGIQYVSRLNVALSWLVECVFHSTGNFR